MFLCLNLFTTIPFALKRSILKYFAGLFAILFSSLVVGCTGSNLPRTVPAEGVVTLDDTAVPNVTIIFIADAGTYNATAVTDKNGKFAMKAFDEKKGAVPGSYKVELTKTIVEGKEGKDGGSEVNLKMGLPKKYASLVTSGISISLPDEGKKDIRFDLKSK
jgi:hypothetical protein